MSQNGMKLQPILNRIRDFFEKPDILLFSEQSAKRFAGRALELIQKMKRADDRIAIGLVGGTGVGKSTLINALAGEEISSSTDLRPTTTNLVLYRHKNNDFSLDEDETVREHQAEPLARVSLADFPDFDSIEPEHRRILSRHFPRLDLLLWVVDPGKYADQALFDWLTLAPQADVNSIFVFNKIDEFQRRYGKEADRVTSETADDLSEKLKKYAHRNDPVILPVSALSALKTGGQDGGPGFAALRNRLKELTDRKLRLSIKELNLEAMVTALADDVARESNSASVESGLGELRSLLDRARKEADKLIDMETRSVLGGLGRNYRLALAAGARDKAPFPIDFFLFVWDKLLGLFGKSRPKGENASPAAPSLAGITRGLAAWKAEAPTAFGPNSSPAKNALENLLNNRFSPEALGDESANRLVDQSLEAAKKFTKRQRWRVRHHIIPLLILAWPFLPLITGWLLPLITGSDAGPKADIRLNLSWADVLPVLEVILAVYLIQTVYYLFKLDKAAGKVLDRLIDNWRKELADMVEKQAFVPVEDYISAVEKEIAEIGKCGV